MERYRKILVIDGKCYEMQKASDGCAKCDLYLYCKEMSEILGECYMYNSANGGGYVLVRINKKTI